MKNNNYNTKLIVVLVISSFLLGSVPAYASSFLNSNLLQAIRGFFNQELNRFTNDIDEETEKIKEEKKKAMVDSIISSTEQSFSNIDLYIDEEVTRIDSELNTFIETLQDELPEVMKEEEDRIKELLTDYVDTKIESSKEELRSDLYRELNLYLLKQNETY